MQDRTILEAMEKSRKEFEKIEKKFIHFRNLIIATNVLIIILALGLL